VTSCGSLFALQDGGENYKEIHKDYKETYRRLQGNIQKLQGNIPVTPQCCCTMNSAVLAFLQRELQVALGLR
jgi:hypothetical protein